jgi:hypothetical protein
VRGAGVARPRDAARAEDARGAVDGAVETARARLPLAVAAAVAAGAGKGRKVEKEKEKAEAEAEVKVEDASAVRAWLLPVEAAAAVRGGGAALPRGGAALRRRSVEWATCRAA